MKMDIEGGEQALLTGPLEWLNRTKAIIAEFHPDIVDYPLLTGLLERQGFKYVPPIPLSRITWIVFAVSMRLSSNPAIGKHEEAF